VGVLTIVWGVLVICVLVFSVFFVFFVLFRSCVLIPICYYCKHYCHRKETQLQKIIIIIIIIIIIFSNISMYTQGVLCSVTERTV
jgi:hypothetical protein